MSEGDVSLEFVRLTRAWVKPLARFLRILEESGDAQFFAPHPNSEASINALVRSARRDLYCLLVEGEEVLAYGLLRGWDEGYEIPSLGIAIHPSARSSGLGRLVMHFLHASAARRGAQKVRLRVRKDNTLAIKLYEDLGYVLEEHGNGYLIGFKSLGNR
jgi:ribosomal protein S18 acetylase RimI-like enzyme